MISANFEYSASRRASLILTSLAFVATSCSTPPAYEDVYDENPVGVEHFDTKFEDATAQFVALTEEYDFDCSVDPRDVTYVFDPVIADVERRERDSGAFSLRNAYVPFEVIFAEEPGAIHIHPELPLRFNDGSVRVTLLHELFHVCLNGERLYDMHDENGMQITAKGLMIITGDYANGQPFDVLAQLEEAAATLFSRKNGEGHTRQLGIYQQMADKLEEALANNGMNIEDLMDYRESNDPLGLLAALTGKEISDWSSFRAFYEELTDVN